MHPIYHTDAFIVGSTPRGEANRLYVLLTSDMGVLSAVSQGVRLEKSKLRYSLQDFSYARIDLVRGKDVWRITSATPIETFARVYQSERGMRFLKNLEKLMRRLVRGEVAHPTILSDVLDVLRFFNKQESQIIHAPVELTLFLRILHTLGYVSPTKVFEEYLGAPFQPERIQEATFPKKEVIEVS